MCSSSPSRSGGISMVIGCPRASSAVYPNSRSAPWFHDRITLCSVLLTIASSDDSTMAARCARARSVRLRSDTSRTRALHQRWLPTRLESAPRCHRWHALSRSRDENRMVGQTDRRAGLQRHAWPGCPRALACFVDNLEYVGQHVPEGVGLGQPVSACATAFMNVTRPSASVVMTASPMLASVVRSHSD